MISSFIANRCQQSSSFTEDQISYPYLVFHKTPRRSDFSKWQMQVLGNVVPFLRLNGLISAIHISPLASWSWLFLVNYEGQLLVLCSKARLMRWGKGNYVKKTFCSVTLLIRNCELICWMLALANPSVLPLVQFWVEEHRIDLLGATLFRVRIM